MRAGEGREHKLSRVGLARRHGHSGAAFVDFHQLIDLGKIQPRCDAVHVKIQRDGDDVEISGALAVAEKRPLHALRARQQPQFSRRDAGAAVVVRVQADDRALAPLQIAAHPFDLVRIHVGHRDFDGVGQIQDHLPLRRRLPHVHHRFANFVRKLDFRRARNFPANTDTPRPCPPVAAAGP